MSKDLIELAKRFVSNDLSADRFSDEFIECWKRERDDGRLLQDPPTESEMLSSIFCLADLYNPQPDREEYEFDERKLRTEVATLLGLTPIHGE